MKKILLLTIVSFTLFSCKDFLSELPRTEVPAETFYSSYDNALRNIAVLYARNGLTNDGIMTEERFRMPSIISQGTITLTATSSSVLNLWSKHYAYIAQANLILKNLEANRDAIDATASLSKYETGEIGNSPTDVLMGEVRFLRAYAYFTLYRYFGGIPLVTTPMGPIPDYIPRSSRQEVFKFLYEEFDYALDKCRTNDSKIAYGRITKGAAAGMLAKAKVFHASYIRRAEKYGNTLNETTGGDISTATLYADALTLCNDLLGGKYGTYKLEEYYPAIFKKRTNEILFSVLANEGVGSGNRIPLGFSGDGRYGATGGQNLTPWLTVLYDIPMWQHNYSLKEVSVDYGQRDRFNTEAIKPGTDPFDLINLYDASGKYTLTGDTTRRMWNTVKGMITGPNNYSAPLGLWVFEPAGRYLGSEFYIEPGKINDYSQNDLNVMEYMESYERTWWRNEPNGQDEPLLWTVRRWRLGKFRNPNPDKISATFNVDYGGVDYPVLRLGEIYLLKAEILIMQGQVAQGVAAINAVRDRACHQSTSRDMFLNQGDAAYSYIAGSVLSVPTTISADYALKELLYERLRELAFEDDCAWLDLTRYPDISMVDMEHVCRYSDPLHREYQFGDPARNEYMWDLYNAQTVWRVLMPIPFTELSFFPEMKQNPGYF